MTLRLVNLAATVPAAPTGETEIDLTWDICGDASSLITRYRNLTTNVSWSRVLTVNASSDNVTGLTASTDYEFWVEGRDSGTNVLVSTDRVTARTRDTLTPPTAPTITSIAGGSTSLTFTIEDNSTDETGFQAQILNLINYSTIVTTHASHTGTGSYSFTASGLPSNTPFEVRVRAINGPIHSDWTDPEWASTLGGPSGVPPSAPANPVFTQTSETSGTLTWEDTSGNETGFHVDIYFGTVTSRTLRNRLTLPANTTSRVITGLIPGQTYTIVIESFNQWGTSFEISETEVYVTFLVRFTYRPQPQPPTMRPVIGYAGGYADVRWDVESITFADYLQVYRDTVPTSSNDLVADNLIQQDGHWLDDGVSTGVEYSYTMVSVNTGGSSDPSDPETVTIPAPLEVDPDNFTAWAVAIDDTKILLGWSTDFPNVYDFVIRETVPSATTIATVPDTFERTYLVTGLTPETAYTFEIDVEDGVASVVGTASCSATTGETLIPAVVTPPILLSTIALSPTQIRASAQVTDIRTYQIKFYTSTDGSSYSLATTTTIPTTISDIGSLTAATLYYVYAKAVAYGVSSGPSNVLQVRTRSGEIGPGRIVSNGPWDTYLRQINKDQVDTTLLTVPANRKMALRLFRFVTPDETNGPFVTLTVDGVDVGVPSTYDGQTVVKNHIIEGGATGVDVSIAVTGTGTTPGTMLMSTEYL